MLSWPSITLRQLGAFESSKSAINTFAPEFSALITIFRSTGPVISTRRSVKSAGIAPTCQSPARIAAVSLKKSGNSPAFSRSCRAWRLANKTLRSASNLVIRALKKSNAAGVKIVVAPSISGALMLKLPWLICMATLFDWRQGAQRSRKILERTSLAIWAGRTFLAA